MKVNKIFAKEFQKIHSYLHDRYSSFHHIEDLPGPNVLVLSPHPDDDIFGCGGALIKHIQLRHNITILYLCQGDKGILNLTHEEARKVRRIEAIKATNEMGLEESSLIFLDQPDEKLSPSQVIVNRVNQVIKHTHPNIIYLPSFIDNHHDHRATNQIIKQCKLSSKTLISGYEIWTPTIPNRILDISDVIDLKKKAITKHKSQLKSLNYLDAITSLNRYRACLYPKRSFEYAEAFIMLKWDHYKKYIS